MSILNCRHSFKLNSKPSVYNNTIDRFYLYVVNNLKEIINYNFSLSFLDKCNFSFIVNFLKFKTSPSLSNNVGYIVN